MRGRGRRRAGNPRNMECAQLIYQKGENNERRCRMMSE
jgi:hypothetical protein